MREVPYPRDTMWFTLDRHVSSSFRRHSARAAVTVWKILTHKLLHTRHGAQQSAIKVVSITQTMVGGGDDGDDGATTPMGKLESAYYDWVRRMTRNTLPLPRPAVAAAVVNVIVWDFVSFCPPLKTNCAP